MLVPRSVASVLWAVHKWRETVVKKEPVLGGAFIGVIVALAGAFGLNLDAGELAITVSVLMTIVAFIQRRLVSPIDK